MINNEKEFRINTEGKVLGEERFTTEDGVKVRLVYIDNLELPCEIRLAGNNGVKLFKNHTVKRTINPETGEVNFEIL